MHRLVWIYMVPYGRFLFGRRCAGLCWYTQIACILRPFHICAGWSGKTTIADFCWFTLVQYVLRSFHISKAMRRLCCINAVYMYHKAFFLEDDAKTVWVYTGRIHHDVFPILKAMHSLVCIYTGSIYHKIFSTWEVMCRTKWFYTSRILHNVVSYVNWSHISEGCFCLEDMLVCFYTCPICHTVEFDSKGNAQAGLALHWSHIS